MTNYKIISVLMSLFALGCGTYWDNPEPENEPAAKPLACGTVSTEYQRYPYGNNEKGRTLFKQNCASCHYTSGTEQQLDLNNVLDRVPSKEWVYNFIQNSDSLIKAGNNYTVQLEKLHSDRKHPEFKDLSRNDIDSIFARVFR